MANYDAKRDARVDLKRRNDRKQAKVVKRSLHSWEDENIEWEYKDARKSNKRQEDDE
jgi:hypothetical protein